MFDQFSTLGTEFDSDGVLTLTLNRPQCANAINGRMHREIVACLRMLDDLRQVGAVVLTGAGKVFSAGGDFELMEETRNADPWSAARTLNDVGRIVREFLDVSVPIVAAINGPAIGLGATLALLSDIVYMASSATLSDPHVRMGLVAGDGGTVVWPALAGPVRAKEFLLTGDPVDAPTAERIGLVNRVVPDAELLQTAHAMAARLAAGPRQAIAYTKRAINTALARDAVANVALSASFEAQTISQPDLVEGIAAFRERRAPSWPSTRPAGRDDGVRVAESG
ncbi:enoyl-CoA hydratase/isomerase family protein [Mycobacterium vicinigordonae]|uniref:Enoyl-CoA hydratase/isomerase family protein n=1 Tax=Mycobacterium vicinigordonae TaxID=1719132 RepID=A0A7D6I3X8_9MYCO|nr:enoyl-CoA hydratase-related protein [Mycobacterium vicinigordonae]QLL06358.1 enoyl-CoA hydratase/isomerase family protein [Mycobacterium vicinigordonae]